MSKTCKWFKEGESIPNSARLISTEDRIRKYIKPEGGYAHKTETFFLYEVPDDPVKPIGPEDNKISHFYVYYYSDGNYFFDRTMPDRSNAQRRVEQLRRTYEDAVYLQDHLIREGFY